MKKTIQEKKLTISVNTVRKLSTQLTHEQLQVAIGGREDSSGGCGGSRAAVC